MPSTPSPTAASANPWARIVRVTRPFFYSEVRWKAIAWLTGLIVVIFGITYLNVYKNTVWGGIFSAISERNSLKFREMGIKYVLVLAIATAIAVFKAFCEQRLGILWRGWLTAHLIGKYLRNRSYHRLMGRSDIDNPDQRMTEDVKSFTTITLSFFLMFMDAMITIVAFSRVVWLISPMLLWVALGYSVLGSFLTILVGRKLVGLNNLQLKKEANFRYELIHVREYADSIALLRGEKKQMSRLIRRLNELVDNFRAIIAVNVRIGFSTIGYNFLIGLIPVIIIAPRFIRGEIEFGDINRAMDAFATLVAALSLIVTKFADISSFAAVVNRLGAIWEALEESPAPPTLKIEVVQDETRISYENLTLRSQKGDKILVDNLNVEVPLGRRMLILGPDGIGKSALVRATAGIWDSGEGRIHRPKAENVLFVPQRPYTALGTLRDQFFDADYLGPDADERLVATLTQLAFGPILDRVGGLDVERDWANLLTVGEQQLLGIARLLIADPKFAFLDRATNALSTSRARHVYELLSRTSITYISVGDQNFLKDFHDNVMELLEDGKWTDGPAHDADSSKARAS